jgi:hypothetical protein
VVAGLYRVWERAIERDWLGEVGEWIEVEVEVRRVRASGRNRFGEVVCTDYAIAKGDGCRGSPREDGGLRRESATGFAAGFAATRSTAATR